MLVQCRFYVRVVLQCSCVVFVCHQLCVCVLLLVFCCDGWSIISDVVLVW